MLDIMRRRRAIRKFTRDRLTDEEINALADAGVLAPSGKNARPVELFITTDKLTIERLAMSRNGKSAAAFETAQAAFIVAARPDKSDVWIEDCSIAASHILLQAESMGLGACWVQIRNMLCAEKHTEDIVRRTLSISDDFSLLCMIAVGRPDEHKPPHSADELRGDAVRFID